MPNSESNVAPTILWDFDGTLGYRDGWWRDCFLNLLGRRDAELVPLLDEHLHCGFPWHTPHRGHQDATSDAAWWERMAPHFAVAFTRCGLSDDAAHELAGRVRDEYLRPDAWHAFPDSYRVLRELADRGWRHAILSNHVPELDRVVAASGLLDLVDNVLTSARIGYEKPHPAAFQAAVAAAAPGTVCWMIGDNPTADIAGSVAVGIPAILVRTTPDGSKARLMERLSGRATATLGAAGPARAVAADFAGVCDIVGFPDTAGRACRTKQVIGRTGPDQSARAIARRAT